MISLFGGLEGTICFYIRVFVKISHCRCNTSFFHVVLAKDAANRLTGILHGDLGSKGD